MTRSARPRPVREAVKRIKPLRDLVCQFDILRKYRRFRPDRFQLVGTDRVLFVDPREPRGCALLRGRGAGQSATKRIWTWALDVLEPDAVIDVGVNYGEFLFLPLYRPGTRVIGIEANPALHPYLERSRGLHPHRDEIELYCAVARRDSQESVAFFVDAEWSGRSSALPHGTIAKPTETSVPGLTVDSLFGGSTFPTRVVFKLDVEGYEPEVLAGMSDLLDGAQAFAGIVEFNPRFERLGISASRFLKDLSALGHVYVIAPGGELGALRRGTEGRLEQGLERGVGDLLILRSRDPNGSRDSR